MQVREQHQDERGERDEVDQDVCERRDEENELGRDGGDENECVQGCAHRQKLEVETGMVGVRTRSGRFLSSNTLGLAKEEWVSSDRELTLPTSGVRSGAIEATRVGASLLMG